MGGHLDVCSACGHERPSYNSCRNRHCPKCQSLAQARWIAQRQERVIPTRYFHVVFTLPEPLRALARTDAEAMYNLLFESATRTLLEFGRSRLQAQIGVTAVLHTWTRDLRFHPHVHCIVTGGGLDDSGNWIPARSRFLFSVKAMAKVFRGKFVEGLTALHPQQPAEGANLKERLYQHDWVVYAKEPFGGPAQVFKYLGRYTHRVGISNQRLLSFDGQQVCFHTKHGKTCTVTAVEFVRRFLLHVLPVGFVKIRHYGLVAAANVGSKLEAARQSLLASQGEMPSTRESEQELPWPEVFRALTGIDLGLCPSCGARAIQAMPLRAAESNVRGIDSS